jgi:HEPN domain-containing protein
MYVEINKNAVLFYKALEDIWCAERTYYGSPNNAVWSCCQAAEKIMKGFLQCYGVNHDSTHDLSNILELVEREYTPQEVATASIYNLARYDQRLRYKNLKTDPTPEDAQATIEDVKLVLDEFAKHAKCAEFIGEAREVHEKMLAAFEAG